MGTAPDVYAWFNSCVVHGNQKILFKICRPFLFRFMVFDHSSTKQLYHASNSFVQRTQPVSPLFWALPFFCGNHLPNIFQRNPQQAFLGSISSPFNRDQLFLPSSKKESSLCCAFIPVGRYIEKKSSPCGCG